MCWGDFFAGVAVGVAMIVGCAALAAQALFAKSVTQELGGGDDGA